MSMKKHGELGNRQTVKCGLETITLVRSIEGLGQLKPDSQSTVKQFQADRKDGDQVRFVLLNALIMEDETKDFKAVGNKSNP